jgi:hypothetical protein
MVIDGIFSPCREHPAQGQRAFDEAASLPPPILLDEGEAALSGGREQRTIQAKHVPTIIQTESLCLSSSRKTAIMAEVNKLSVEKALDKLHAGAKLGAAPHRKLWQTEAA